VTPPPAAAPDSPSWWLWRRLAWRQAAALLLAIVLAAGTVAWRTVATIRSLDDVALQSQAHLVADQLSPGPNGEPVLQMPAQLDAEFSSGDGGNFYLVLDQAGKVVIGSNGAAAGMLMPYLPPPAQDQLFRVPSSERYPAGLLATVLTVPFKGGAWRVVVAQAQEQQEALLASLLHEFLVSALWFLGPIGAAVVLVGVLTTRHGLRPLRDASAAATRIGPQEQGRRLPEAGLPGELVPLVGAMNGALTRLERALDAQRRFVGEAAHALRTPLAVLTARIDALPRGPAADALGADIDRMSRLVAQMLTMARLEELPLDVSGRVDLVDVAVEAISARALLAIGAQVELVLDRPPGRCEVAGNRDALGLALGNLIDNALAHAPRGSAVEVEVACDPPRLAVLDRGPGVPEADRARIFSRFERGRTAAAGGAGLGLAIVGRIAAAHGGSASVTTRDGGGAVFALAFSPRVMPG
jgi:two-component system sensor histidine kinase TctE